MRSNQSSTSDHGTIFTKQINGVGAGQKAVVIFDINIGNSSYKIGFCFKFKRLNTAYMLWKTALKSIQFVSNDEP